MKRLAALALALACAGASAQALGAGPRPPAVAFAPRPGAALPRELVFTDADGRAVRLGDALGPGPALLALGYYRCPQLCGLLMQGLLEAVHADGLPAASTRIVFVSIDPRDTPADAAVRRRVDLDYARFLDAHAAPPPLELLVGTPDRIAALARAVGYDALPTDDAAAAFAHPAGVLVVTPDGRVSRLLAGVRYDPAALRAALVDASGGRVGGVGDRLALLCAHVDPRLGRHSEAVLAGMRVAGVATLLLVAALVRRRVRGERAP